MLPTVCVAKTLGHDPSSLCKQVHAVTLGPVAPTIRMSLTSFSQNAAATSAAAAHHAASRQSSTSNAAARAAALAADVSPPPLCPHCLVINVIIWDTRPRAPLLAVTIYFFRLPSLPKMTRLDTDVIFQGCTVEE
jgi:hypothetical protein